MKVLVIIPAYNEEENIVRFVRELISTCPDVDYIVINDCSKDRTKEILKENGLINTKTYGRITFCLPRFQEFVLKAEQYLI